MESAYRQSDCQYQVAGYRHLQCEYFGVCGSCKVYDRDYDTQFEAKLAQSQEEFREFFGATVEGFASPHEHYRARAEFRIWHEGDALFYAMHPLEGKIMVQIDACKIVRESIADVMPKLLHVIAREALGHKLFGTDFLSSSSGEIVVTLIYHKVLDDAWRIKAKAIADELGIHIIGRSRKQKEVLTQDFVTESLHVKGRDFHFRHIENSFTQPNPAVNEAMIGWAMGQFEGIGGDLLELYCGAGNFTIPFATLFEKVLATEISKSSIFAAKTNMALNSVSTIDFVRLGVEEFVEALDGLRVFRRMQEVDLNAYDFNAIFVDPPRAGMDETSCRFASRFNHIVYISCNPETLYRDLQLLCKTHEITAMALFDQFPYTHHREMGVKLVQKGGV